MHKLFMASGQKLLKIIVVLPTHLLILLISRLENLGLTPTDIHNLEYLEDKKVLENLHGGFRWLKRNLREDVIVYFETMAETLEEELLRKIELPEIEVNVFI
jgi:hypothetical protein